MSGPATFKMSAAVDSEPRIDPAGVGEVGVVPCRAAAAVSVHLRHEGGHAAGVPAGQQVGVVVGRVHQQPAEHLLLRQLLADGHLRVGVVVDGVVVVVVDVRLRHGDVRPRLVRRQRMVAQDDVGRHQLGQAGHRHRLLGARGHVDADGRDGDGALAGGRPRERHGLGRDLHRRGQRPSVTAGAGSAALRRTPTNAPAATHHHGQDDERDAGRPPAPATASSAPAASTPCRARAGCRRTARATSPDGTAPP